MIKVAMLSKWHVHAGAYANMVKNSGKAEIVAVWDEVVERGEAWAKELGADFHADLDALLAREDIEAVICDAPTTAHHDVIIKAARAGKHVFTEKALCPTVKECLEVKEVLEETGVTFVISFPQRGRPSTQFAKKLVDDGLLGQIVSVRMRDAHAGQFLNWLPDYWYDKNQAAGGAMMDLGCHPMYLLAYFLGKPKRITGLYTAPFGKPVDENAVAIAEFANGAIGVAETSLISRNSPQTLEIYGTEGSFICHGNDVMFSSVKLENKDMQKPENLPEEKPAPILQFLDCVAEGKPAPEELNIDAAIGLTELLELSYVADENNTIVVAE